VRQHAGKGCGSDFFGLSEMSPKAVENLAGWAGVLRIRIERELRCPASFGELAMQLVLAVHDVDEAVVASREDLELLARQRWIGRPDRSRVRRAERLVLRHARWRVGHGTPASAVINRGPPLTAEKERLRRVRVSVRGEQLINFEKVLRSSLGALAAMEKMLDRHPISRDALPKPLPGSAEALRVLAEYAHRASEALASHGLTTAD
jgi:hypothetical protein